MMSRQQAIHLGCDTGEAPGGAWRQRELALLEHVTAVSIACGGHAGDDESMRIAVAAAVERGVLIGAHPSYPDRIGFGRRTVSIGRDELLESLQIQLGSLARIGETFGTGVSFVKPHGALYHAAAIDEHLARDLGRAAEEVLGAVAMVGAAGSESLTIWREQGMAVLVEGFVDRVYEDDGTLRSRVLPGAVVESPERAAEQARSIVDRLGVNLLCVHADTPNAVEIAARVRADLEADTNLK